MTPIVFSIIFFSVLAFLSWLSFFDSEPLGKNKFLFSLLCIYIICFLGLRNQYVGTDTPFYVEYFLYPQSGYRGNEQDIGYSFFNAIIRAFSTNVTFYLFASNLVALSGLLVLIYKKSSNYLLSLCLFWIFSVSSNIFSYYCGMQRQIISMGFCFFAIYFWTKYNCKYRTLLALVAFLIAFSIHTTSLFCFVLYMLGCKIRINDTNVRKFMIVVFATYILGCLTTSLNSVLNAALQIVGLADNHYAVYVNGQSSAEDITATYKSYSLFINMLSFPLTVITELMLYVKYKRNDFLHSDILFGCFLIGVIVNNVFVSNVIWGRLTCYATMLFLICIPNFLETLKFELKYMLWTSIWALYVFKTSKVLLHQISSNASGNIYIPFTFFN